MGKKKVYPKGEKAQKLFMEKYGDIIDTLKKMPRKSDEEKGARYFFWKENQTDDLILLLFKAVKPEESEKLLEESGRFTDLTSKSIKDIQELFYYFIEAVKQQTRVYTGISVSGKKYTFFQAIGQEIVHIQSKNGFKRQRLIELSGVSSDKQRNIIKLAKLLEDACFVSKKSQINSANQVDSFLHRAEELNNSEFDGTLSEKECLFAVDYALGIGIFAKDCSLDAPVGEDGETSLLDMIADKRTGFEELDMDNPDFGNQKFFHVLGNQKRYQFLIESKKELFRGTKRSDWEWIVWFTQVSILITLKLKKSCASNEKEYGISSRRESFSKRTEDRYNYYRYTVEPAGDEDIYHVLEPSEKLIYDSILDKRYLLRAFSEERFPEDLYDTYNNLLEESFNFSSKIQAECLRKSESVISKKLVRYRTVLMPQLEEWLEIVREK